MPVEKTVKISWDSSSANEKLASALDTLAMDYPFFHDGSGDVSVKFETLESAGELLVTKEGTQATVKAGSTAMALRGISYLMSGLVEDGKPVTEKTSFETFGIMLDCSRNAVMTVEHFKKWLRKLSLLGYNMAMLYTEDTYELPSEPYFGYMRGAYTAEELKEIDDYAARLDMEMIPCIQTLGHLEQILKWGAYDEVKDTGSVLLVDEDKTYVLIEKMIAHWADTFRTRRIHVGMDETHDLGRGKFMDKYGYERGFDIFNRHLSRVVDICEKHGLSPMIWSDMYFRMGSKTGGYYDKDTVIPADVSAMIPKQAQLVYWDYYNTDKDFYSEWVKRHRDMGFEPIMGSGVWTWKKVWHDRFRTETNGGACIEGCLNSGVKEIFFTMWGDNGAYCDFDSAFAGLAFVAEKSFAGKIDETALAARYATVCKGDYNANSLASEMTAITDPAYIIWEDPLLAMHMLAERTKNESELRESETKFREIAEKLEAFKNDNESGDLNHARLIALVSAERLKITESLITAYAANDKAALEKVRAMIPEAIGLTKEMAESFRSMWLSHNKPFGLEGIQVRCAGAVARLEELDRRLKQFIAGEVKTIEELDAHLPQAPKTGSWWSYGKLATGSCVL